MFSYHTPFTPPTEEDELSFLRLVRSRRVGATTFHRLIAEHGDARAALAALPGLARASGVSDYEPCPEGVARAELKAGKRLGAKLLCHGLADYPSALTELSDAPPVLWAQGDLGLLARPAVAVVGARNASSLGLRMARKLAGDLGSRGFVIVSGIARGIDAAAHDAALATGTIGVQAGGIDIVYPKENADLTARIGETGLRLAENPPGTAPRDRHFPQRNRIIAGLAQATLVVEAALASGSLLSARMALDYGREVFAVPGHPFDGRAGGCNALLRDGAVLTRNAEDVIEVLGQPGPPEAPPARQPAPRPQPAHPPAGALPERILHALGAAPTPADALIRDLEIAPATLAPVLVELEIEGRIQRHPGDMYSRA